MLICVTLFITVVGPLYNNVSQLRIDVATYNAALANSNYLEKAQDALLGQYKNIQEDDRVRLEHFLPSSINNIEFILEIEQIANLHNMPIKDINFDSANTGEASPSSNTATATDPSSNKPYGTFPVEFTISGSYDSFESFLKDLEQNLRLIDVQSVSFSVPDATKDNPNPTYDFTLKVNTYWLK